MGKKKQPYYEKSISSNFQVFPHTMHFLELQETNGETHAALTCLEWIRWEKQMGKNANTMGKVRVPKYGKLIGKTMRFPYDEIC